MNKLVRIVAPLAVLGLGLGTYALLAAFKPEPEKREEGPRPVTVFVETIVPADIALKVVTQAEVRSRIAIDLVAQVSGRIASVSSEFTEGGSFRPGETLVAIEDIDYRLALSQAEARVAEAEVGVEVALADADVARKQLRNTKNPSALALKKPQVAQAKASLIAAKADLEQARVNLDRSRVSLPFEGRITKTYVDLGQFVAAGTPLGQAFATDRVELRLPIKYDQLSALGLPIGYIAEEGGGRSVDIFANIGGLEQRWQGKLVRMDASIDSDTRLIYAIAVVEDPYGKNSSQHSMPLAGGLYVDVVIQGRSIQKALRIPRSALRAGDTVYVVNKEGLLNIRSVDVIHSSPDFAVIHEGLNPGEQVIVSTIRNPLQGMAVQASERPAREVVGGGSSKDNGQG
ncbi:MAG: efflux RND transporter periplasmic adaptor subunit [Proteobacteria bacterium]|nr:efflux RND transporter periplasmic adaptor subunit [Pseudomonadota bacterium]